MRFLTASIVLSILVMTRAAEDLSSLLNQPPLPEQLYLFDVTSDSSLHDIKASFDVIGEPRHSFKVIGEPTYYFVAVAASINTKALRQLTFPKGSVVTQFPVEHINDFFQLVGGDRYPGPDEVVFDDSVLTVGIWEFRFPKGTSVRLFDLMMAAYDRQYEGDSERFDFVSYVPIAYYPLKMYYFFKIEDNYVQQAAKNGHDVIGGVGNAVVVTFKHIVKI